MTRCAARATPGCTAWPWRRAVRHGVLALGLAASGVADACTLDALLRLPLERLMELTITRALQDPRAATHQAPVTPVDRSSHAR